MWYAHNMRKLTIKIINYILIISILVVGVGSVVNKEMVVWATSSAISNLKDKIKGTQDQIKNTENQIKNTQNQLSNINDKIISLSDQQDLAEEMIADLNAEIINTMTSVGMKEDEIAAKEAEIVIKQEEIATAEEDYEAAKLQEEQQYDAMVKRIRDMYEMGSNAYMKQLLTGEGLSGLLNRMDFVEEVYEYDRVKLTEYETLKNQVNDLRNRLEEEKEQLQYDKGVLENDRRALQVQQSNLDALLAHKKQESANFEAEISEAKQEAAKAKKLLQQEQQQLLQEQQQLAQEQQQLAQLENRKDQPGSGGGGSGKPAKPSGDSGYNSIIDASEGSELGKNVAKYACQFIGNPYVYGGTSLTNGADCSGFTYRVYKDFGYNLPRTSLEQRSTGTGVSYSEAHPGDLICYDGHVGIYIGGGKIVHASSARTGIKVSNAEYRTILAVRRIIN